MKRSHDATTEPSPAPSASSDALCVTAASASVKGRKLTNEDVVVAVPWLDRPASEAGGAAKEPPPARRAFYAVLDGHGGRDCADWVAERLPSLLVLALQGAHASAEIKEAMRKAFVQCDTELLAQCERRGWADGCCAIGLLLDSLCSPPRAYVANLGDSRAYAAVVDGTAEAPAGASTATAAEGGGGGSGGGSSSGGGGVRAVALSKDHSPLDAKEKKRVMAAGGFVEGGRVGGCLEVSRSLGDARFKRLGVSATPDVTSFAIGAAQRFVLLACDGVWGVMDGQRAIEWVHARLPAMDARRTQLAAQLSADAASGLTRERLERLRAERDGATEAALLRELLHECVAVRHAKDNCTVMLVRLHS